MEEDDFKTAFKEGKSALFTLFVVGEDIIVYMTNQHSSIVNFIRFARHQQLQRDKYGEGRAMREGGEPNTKWPLT